MAYEHWLLEEQHNYAILTLNRPEVKNALNSKMRAEFSDFVLNRAKNYNAVVLAGSGDVFCSGMDMKEPLGPQESRDQWGIFRDFYNCTTPFIGAINGKVRGAGLTLVTACDIVISEPDVDYGQPQIRHGFIGTVAAPNMLLQTGKKYVAEMVLTGLPMPPERMLQAGLVNSICASGESVNEAKKLAEVMSEYKRETLMFAKKMLSQIPYGDDERDETIGKVGGFVREAYGDIKDRVIERGDRKQ